LRGKLDLALLIKEKGHENFFVSEITIIELRFGAENSINPEKAHKAVDGLINGLSIVPVYGAIRRYASEKVRLRKIGTPLNDDFDLLIGATAIENDLILITDNVKHFELLNNIKIENWYRN
jgi:tRNA(fMet)-specific endonuclease VapC